MIHSVRIGLKTHVVRIFEELVVCHSATRLKQLKRLQESSILSCVASINYTIDKASKSSVKRSAKRAKGFPSGRSLFQFLSHH